MKVTTIEEAQDIIKSKVDELIGSLLTFEMVIKVKYDKQSKSVAFKVDVADGDDQLEGDADETLIELIALIAKKFRKLMRILDRRSRNNVIISVKTTNIRTKKLLTFSVKEKMEKNKTGER